MNMNLERCIRRTVIINFLSRKLFINSQILKNDCNTNSNLDKDFYLGKQILSEPATAKYIPINQASIYIRTNINSEYEILNSITGISVFENGNDCICSNLLTGAIFYFQMGGGTILDAKVDIFLTKSVFGSCNSNTDLEQFFQVKFVDQKVNIIIILFSKE